MRKAISLAGLILLIAINAFAAPIIYQAESGTLNGTYAASSRPGYSGAGYVDGFDNNGDYCQVSVNVTNAGMYRITIGYSTGTNGEKYNNLYANGVFQSSVHFTASTGFSSVDAGLVPLNAGANTVRIQKDWGYFYLDWFGVEEAVLPSLSVPDTLVNTAASAATQCLMKYLVSNYGSYIISGQSNTPNAQWIYGATGKYPALCGFDMMDYTDSRIARGAYSTDVNKAIAWHQAGGIVQFQWHWGAPMHLIDGPEGSGQEWYRGFYTNATTFDVQYAMNNTSSAEYLALLNDIDDIAAQLKILRDAGVPVLWRPLHEAQGTWFWWGAKGSTACKQLYWLIFDRMTNLHGLNNLIWVWTTQDNAEAANWYPGHAYVDAVGADIYLSGLNYSPSAGIFYNIVNLVGGQKLVAMTENGTMPDPDLMSEQHAHWSWFMTWNGYESDASQNSLSHVQAVYTHSYVKTKDELSGVYACVLASPTPTVTRTGTPVHSPTVTLTVTETITGTPPTETSTCTITPTFSATPTATQDRSGEALIIDTVFSYPNPAGTGNNPITIKASFNKPVAEVSVRIYTFGFRLIKERNLIAAPTAVWEVEMPTDGLSNGLYFYLVMAKDPAGSMIKKRADQFIILR